MNAVQLAVCSHSKFDKALKAMPNRSMLFDITEKKLWYVKRPKAHPTEPELILLADNDKALNAITKLPVSEDDSEKDVIISDNDEREYLSTDWIVCKGLTVTTDDASNHTKWVANQFLGTYSAHDGHTYFLFSHINDNDEAIVVGDFLLRSPTSCYTFGLTLTYNKGMKQLDLTNSDAPVEIYYASLNGQQFLALKITDGIEYDICFTGWNSSQYLYTDLTYTDSDLTDITLAITGDIAESAFSKVYFKYGDTASNVLTIYNAKSDWSTPLYLKFVAAPGDSNGESLNLKGGSNTDSAANMASILTTITSDEDKPVYLDMSNLTHMSDVNTRDFYKFNSGLLGLYGIVFPKQDAYLCTGLQGFLSGLPNLISFTIADQQTFFKNYSDSSTSGTGYKYPYASLKNCPNLEYVDFGEGLLSVPDDQQFLVGCNNLKFIRLYRTDDVVSLPQWSSMARDWAQRDAFTIYVPKDLLQSYKQTYANGYIANLFRGM